MVRTPHSKKTIGSFDAGTTVLMEPAMKNSHRGSRKAPRRNKRIKQGREARGSKL
jgi:hypothetical protein